MALSWIVQAIYLGFQLIITGFIIMTMFKMVHTPRPVHDGVELHEKINTKKGMPNLRSQRKVTSKTILIHCNVLFITFRMVFNFDSLVSLYRRLSILEGVEAIILLGL